MRFVIKPIYDLIRDYDELIKHDRKVLTIFASKNKYQYKFNAIELDFSDVGWGCDGFIEDRHCEQLMDIDISDYDLILIGCDAGLCRSPAIAAALFTINGHPYIGHKIQYNYPHINMDVYAKIISYKDERTPEIKITV